MAEGVSRKISAASSRAHTRRRAKHNSSPVLPPGILKKLVFVFFVGILAWAYQAIQPPPPKICGSPAGPPVTGPRIKLRDGRHLAYKEHGVAKDVAKHKIIFLHGFDSCRHDAVVANHLSPEIAEELGVHIVSFDRPGYGESDPHPKRTLKSLASDIEELADQLGLGSRFYITGFSMGGQFTWSCLKYIPHRIVGATLIAPVVHIPWPGFPANLSAEILQHAPLADLWAVRITRYAPWLTYWWNTQKWFPSSSVVAHAPHVLSPQDQEIAAKLSTPFTTAEHARQQGEQESIFRDMIVSMGKWEFDPMDMENPFPNGEGSVHLWQGDADRLVPVRMQRYLAQRLPWVHYHELPGAGHLFPFAEGMADTIVKTMLSGH